MMFVAFSCFFSAKVMGQKALPYSYGFENNLSGEGWTGSGWHSGTGIKNTNVYDGSYCFDFSANSSYISQYLISPELESSSGLNIEFYYKTGTSVVYNFKLGYSTTDTNTGSFTWVDEFGKKDNYYTLYSHDIEVSEIKYLAILFYDNTSNYTHCYIDNVTITALSTPTCTTPSSLHAEGLSSSEVYASWTPGGNETEWLLYYSTSYDTPSDDLVSGPGIITVSTNPSYTLTNLTSGTHYNLWVRAKCSDSEYSGWSWSTWFATSYTQAIPFDYGFETDDLDRWTMLNSHVETGISSAQHHTGEYSYKFYASPMATESQYLITPELTGTSNGASVELYMYATTSTAKLHIGYSTTNKLLDSFIWDTEHNTTANTWKSYSYICPANTKYVAIKYVPNSVAYIDDITISVPNNFTTTGNWDVANNWSKGTLPTATDNVVVTVPCVIPNNCIAQAKNIAYSGTGSITVVEGGQLVCNNPIAVTFQKSITGYSSTKDNYYLMASPVVEDINPALNGMLSSGVEYDLYYFDESQELEWRNYKLTDFVIENGKGYLYAKAQNATASFTGTSKGETSGTITGLAYTNGAQFAGFNLVGNPYLVDITRMNFGGSEINYYKLTSEGTFTATTAAETPIKVGEGFMIQTTTTSSILHLNPSSSKDSEDYDEEVIRLEVTNSQFKDVAYIRFGNSMALNKIGHINEEAPMLYINNDDDYAVAVFNNRGDVKSVNVNFEAKTMGTYTISAKTEKGNVSYMRLIDRLTGTETDILNDNYSFVGSNIDIANRFILKFEAAGNNIDDDILAFQNGSDIIVKGEGELQIFDVMGRNIMNTMVNGVQTVNVKSHGVYIFKLNEKTQKIVVR